LPQDVERILARTGLEPGRLRLEITEGVALRDDPVMTRTLRGLKELGIRLAIDDFGAGYSSLSYLTRLTADTLKIDRQFIAGIDRDEARLSIVRALISLTESFGLEATAEGVETAAQVECLRSLRCRNGQGFYFGKPVPAARIKGLLNSPQRRVALQRRAWLRAKRAA
jgi:EAL domain-containing protein (putative c-di-GMP-specific phosphodiesterase class I)